MLHLDRLDAGRHSTVGDDGRVGWDVIARRSEQDPTRSRRRIPRRRGLLEVIHMGDRVEYRVVIDVEQASDANLVVAVGRWHRARPGRDLPTSRRRRPRPGAANPAERPAGRGDHPGGLPRPLETPREVRRPARDAPLLPAGPHPREVGRLRAVRGGSAPARGARRPRETATAGYDIDHEVWDMAVADQVKEALGEPARRAPPADRAGLLRRPHLPGGGGDARTSRRAP